MIKVSSQIALEKQSGQQSTASHWFRVMSFFTVHMYVEQTDLCANNHLYTDLNIIKASKPDLSKSLCNGCKHGIAYSFLFPSERCLIAESKLVFIVFLLRFSEGVIRAPDNYFF